MSAAAADLRVDVVVVGGGLVGLTLGHALASAGIVTAVVDRESPADLADDAHDGRASAIAHGSERVLAALGIWEHAAQHACPILDIRVSDGGFEAGASRLFLHYDHREVGDPLGYIVENRFIRRALYRGLEKRPDLKLIAPARVEGLERIGARVRAHLADGRGIKASLAIAADGRSSPTRAAAGIAVTEWAYGQTAIVCAVAHERDHRNVAHERFLPAGPFAMLPLPGRSSSLVWTERSRIAGAMLALDDAGFAAELQRRFGDELGQLSVAGRRWSYPLGLLLAERSIDQRLALIGDAAHAIHPIAGQGLNLGIRDVAALAEVLVDASRLGLDIGQLDVLERYQRWRRFDTLSLIAATDGLNRLFQTSLPPVKLARDLGLAVVNELPGLKRLFMRHAMGTLGDLPRLVQGLAL
ncbi:MAG: UbiH/UbiF/VisC/COQ6 family ubiquinone biosynthesis hydroxylase [Proteobacteria bacterium]|nr:UbiH/UbiF/VisC/COQ6 family ubiquinone biosynthesis hydroxylase [Pseudomonadota bacterium]MBI3499715.1 UbiH/UbiF/VisC/COQ6 family ubiquinone biosynthesis hydroxylase [Pseudomonadota bacterium]